MGDDLTAARAKLRLDPAGSFGAPVLRPEVPGGGAKRAHAQGAQGAGAGVVRTEAFYYAGITTFCIVVGTIYWFTSYEDAGAVMLAACALLGLFAGSYLFVLSRRYPP